MSDSEDTLPEEGTQVIFHLKNPVIFCRGVFRSGVFEIHDHWALKYARPEEVERWDYQGQIG